MEEKKKERWYNLYLDHEEEARYAEGVYDSEEEAKANLPRRYYYSVERISGRTKVFAH